MSKQGMNQHGHRNRKLVYVWKGQGRGRRKDSRFTRPRNFSVYLLTDRENGRLYVGQTYQPIGQCLQQHFKKPNGRMHHDVLCAPEPELLFSIACLETTASPTLAEDLEEFYICEFDTRSAGGYNALRRHGTQDPSFHV